MESFYEQMENLWIIGKSVLKKSPNIRLSFFSQTCTLTRVTIKLGKIAELSHIFYSINRYINHYKISFC